MRIIKKANAEEIKVTCERCDSIYTYAWYDIKDFSYSDSLENVKRDGVLCPVCNTLKVLNEVIT